MLTESLELQLTELEAQLADLAASLLDADPEHVRIASQGVQRLVGACAQLAASPSLSGSAPLRGRLVKISQSLGLLREQLARRQAYVDHALKLLIPSAQPATTYGSKGLYASANRASGSLRPVSA